jgi:thiamine biosynthesis lipoprotein
MQAVIDAMSPWEPQSAISRFNRAPAGTWCALPDAFFTVLRAALDMAEETAGAYDPAIGRLVDLWGFGPGATSGPPDDAALDAARREGGFARLELDHAGKRLRQPGGLSLDLNSIAKGYAVDRLAHALERLGLESHLVEIGGEFRGKGMKPDGHPWWVMLENPPDAPRALPEFLIALHGLSVATSGNYRRTRFHEGKTVSHIIDPLSGRPLMTPIISVSVLAADCMTADAWATAVMAVGIEEGLRLAERHGLFLRIVERRDDGCREWLSGALERQIEAP